MTSGLVLALVTFVTIFVLGSAALLVRSPLFSDRWVDNRSLRNLFSVEWARSGRASRASGVGLVVVCAIIAMGTAIGFDARVFVAMFVALLMISNLAINVAIEGMRGKNIEHWWKQQLAVKTHAYLYATITARSSPTAGVATTFHRLWALACVRAGLVGAVGLEGEKSTPRILSFAPNRIVVDPVGFSVEAFEAAADKLKVTLNRRLGSVEQTGPNRVAITFESVELPRMVVASAVRRRPKEIALGVTRDGLLSDRPANWPHMMVAGTSGSGKSTFLVFIVHQIIAEFHDAVIVAVDVKRKDFEAFAAWPNFVRARNPGHLSALAGELERERQRRETGEAGNNCDVFVVIDEFNAVVDDTNLRNLELLASLSRSANYHMIFASQRPTISDTAITGIIRENLDLRVCFRVKTARDSMIIVDSKTAAKIRKIPGRAIVADNATGKSVEMQSPYTTAAEIRANIAAHLPGCKRQPLAETLRGIIEEIDRFKAMGFAIAPNAHLGKTKTKGAKS